MEVRRAIFTGDERAILLELVRKHKRVIENKKLDCISLSQKKKTWYILANEFNSLPNTCKRTTRQLRKCWENIKARRRKELADVKRSIFNTTNGKMPELLIDDNDIDDVMADVDIKIRGMTDSVLQEDIHIVHTKPEPSTTIDRVNDCNDAGLEIEKAGRIATYTGMTKTFMPRRGASEEVLQSRLNQTSGLQPHEEKQQSLQMEAELLKVMELKIRLEEANLRKKILEEQYEQEKLKTFLLRREYNK